MTKFMIKPAPKSTIRPTPKPVVRARIDEHIKEEATAVLESIGLTVSDAFRLMMVRIAKDKALPFEPLIPNAETIEAMRAARRGELVTVGSVDALFADLNADD
jgi:DNA-damage-inducible protein J